MDRGWQENETRPDGKPALSPPRFHVPRGGNAILASPRSSCITINRPVSLRNAPVPAIRISHILCDWWHYVCSHSRVDMERPDSDKALRWTRIELLNGTNNAISTPFSSEEQERSKNAAQFARVYIVREIGLIYRRNCEETRYSGAWP